MEDILFIFFIVSERPFCLEDEILLFREERRLALCIEFRSGERSEYFSKEKISLLVCKLVGKRDWFGK